MVELRTPGVIEQIIVVVIFLLPFIIAVSVIGILIKLVLSKSSRPLVRRIAFLSLVLIISIIIVFETLSLPKTINEPNEQNNIACGWPLPFMTLVSLRNPPYYPWTESCIGWQGSSMDTEKKVSWLSFFTNVTLVFIFLVGVFWIHKMVRKKMVKRQPPPS